MENYKYWLAFASIETIGSTFIQKLYDYFGDIETAWNADISDFVNIENITKKQIDAFLKAKQQVNPDACFDYILSKDIKFVTYSDKEYPYLLKNIYNPPMVLFIAGDLNRCNLDRALAVVGSRKASEQSKDVLEKMISGFSQTDVCIVSGLASGIDTVAHCAAIKNNLTTIGVLGGGFDHLYPRSNKQLFEKIKQQYGAVLSEYWPTFEPIAWRFPHRNRIVSGLCQGTLVAEAAIKSGALITAKLALEQGRELMCIPGAITNPNTEGIYKLLKDGATLVTNSSDIFDAMNWEVVKNIPLSDNTAIDLNGSEKLILDLIQRDSLGIDALIAKSNLNINDLMVILTNLEIKGLVKQTEGDKYISLVLK